MSMKTTPIARDFVADNVSLTQVDNVLSVKDGGVTKGKISGSGNFLMPIRATIPWDKTLTGTPALPDGWVECNGQTIDDAESDYNGETIRNLNGNSNVIKGGATSGDATTEDFLPSHTHQLKLDGDNPAWCVEQKSIGGAWQNNHINSKTSGTATDFISMVWIMRIK